MKLMDLALLTDQLSQVILCFFNTLPFHRKIQEEYKPDRMTMTRVGCKDSKANNVMLQASPIL